MKKNKNENTIESISEIWLSDFIARAIGIFKYDKPKEITIFDTLKYSLDYPIVIYLTRDFISEFKENKGVAYSIFDNLNKNEQILMEKLNFTDNDTQEINYLANEFSDFVDYDLSKKIDIFVNNPFTKVKKIILEKYLNNEELLAEIHQKYNINKQKFNWLVKKISDASTDEWSFVMEKNKLVLKSNDVDYKKVEKLMLLIMRNENIEPEIFLSHFQYLFTQIQNKCQTILKNESILEHKTTSISYLTTLKLKVIISYFKLLTIRVFEFFDLLKFISSNENIINQFASIIYHIELEINYIKSLFK